jgi:hypothetical protein
MPFLFDGNLIIDTLLKTSQLPLVPPAILPLEV